MRVILARCDLVDKASRRSLERCVDVLKGEGCRIEQLVLPALGPLPGSLCTVASHRLLDLSASADALLCISATAAVLPHPKKIVWLLDPAPLGAEPEKPRPLDVQRRRFLDNTLVAALKETDSLFVPSQFAKKRLLSLGLGNIQLLRPPHEKEKIVFRRNPGPELLCLRPLTEQQRPHLLVECLSRLPEPIRARWIAPVADSDLLHRVRTQANEMGVGHRLTLDVRSIDAHERAYLLSQALAYLHLEADSWLIGDAMRSAASLGVPLLACSDGGAAAEFLSERSNDLPTADAKALAKAIERFFACAEGARRVDEVRPPRASWAPLLKAMRL